MCGHSIIVNRRQENHCVRLDNFIFELIKVITESACGNRTMASLACDARVYILMCCVESYHIMPRLVRTSYKFRRKNRSRAVLTRTSCNKQNFHLFYPRFFSSVCSDATTILSFPVKSESPMILSYAPVCLRMSLTESF